MTNYLRKSKSLFSTTLSSSIGTGTGETITLASVTGLPTDTEIVITIDRVDASGSATPTKMERIKGTLSGSNLTSYTRGVDSSTEQAHSGGAVIEIIWNAADWNDFITGFLVGHTQTGAHGASVIVASNIAASAVAAGTIAASAVTAGNLNFTAATLTGSETLTNKTISNPRIDASDSVAQTYTPSASGTATLDLSLGNEHRITMPAGNITIALSNDTNAKKFIVSITQDSGGSRTVTWFSTIKWTNGTTPTLTTTANKRDTFGFIRTGTGTYDGFVIGQNI